MRRTRNDAKASMGESRKGIVDVAGHATLQGGVLGTEAVEGDLVRARFGGALRRHSTVVDLGSGDHESESES